MSDDILSTEYFTMKRTKYLPSKGWAEGENLIEIIFKNV